LEIAEHQQPYVVKIKINEILMPNCRLSAVCKTIWLEKMTFGFFSSVGRKKVV